MKSVAGETMRWRLALLERIDISSIALSWYLTVSVFLSPQLKFVIRSPSATDSETTQTTNRDGERQILPLSTVTAHLGNKAVQKSLDLMASIALEVQQPAIRERQDSHFRLFA